MSGKPTLDSIKALLAQSPYSTSNQAQLEAFVDAQATGEATYYMDANRSLLKIYQFIPQNSNESKISMIFLLSLLEFPSTDCLAFSYLLPEKLAKVEPTASILHCCISSSVASRKEPPPPQQNSWHVFHHAPIIRIDKILKKSKKKKCRSNHDRWIVGIHPREVIQGLAPIVVWAWVVVLPHNMNFWMVVMMKHTTTTTTTEAYYSSNNNRNQWSLFHSVRTKMIIFFCHHRPLYLVWTGSERFCWV